MNQHVPKLCKSCNAPIFWAQVLGPEGKPQVKPDGKPRCIPVDAAPSDRGNILLADREGTVVAKVLGKPSSAAPGAVLRISHFVTCPQANTWNRDRKRGHR